MRAKNSFDKRPNSFQIIPKNDIKRKMLRFKIYIKMFAAGRALKFSLVF